MLKPARRRKGTPGAQISTSATIPAPTGGWNTRDPLSAMNPKYAVTLDNWFPRATDVQIRGGCAYHATSSPRIVKQLMAYSGVSVNKLFACTDSDIYDVTAAGVFGASVRSITSPYFSYTNFQTVAGKYLVCVNGSNDLQLYDGATWTSINAVSTPAITGATTSDFNFVISFKRRLFFIKKNSLSVYYLPVDQIGGAAVEFPVGQFFKKGGYLVALGAWTIDGGEGVDDQLVFISSEGELIVYKGTDPSSAVDWEMVGRYFIGRPMGGRSCVNDFGGDLVYLCESGLYPLSKALQSAIISRESALSDQIQQQFAEASRLYSGNTGWDITIFPKQNALLINIPYAQDQKSVQYVMNTITGSWCRFVNWDAFCFEVFQGELYFGGSNFVAKAWTPENEDFAANVVADGRTAFNYFGTSQRSKFCKLIRPMLIANGAFSYSITVDSDFQDLGRFAELPSVVSSFGKWDAANWDEVNWAPDWEVTKEWKTVFSKEGLCLSVRLRVASRSTIINWSSVDLVLEKGGVL